MIIDDFNIICIAAFPLKAYAPLVIYTYAVLTLAVPFKSFQPVSGRDFERFYIDRGIYHVQLAQGNTLYIAENPGMTGVEKGCCFFI